MAPSDRLCSSQEGSRSQLTPHQFPKTHRSILPVHTSLPSPSPSSSFTPRSQSLFLSYQVASCSISPLGLSVPVSSGPVPSLPTTQGLVLSLQGSAAMCWQAPGRGFPCLQQGPAALHQPAGQLLQPRLLKPGAPGWSKSVLNWSSRGVSKYEGSAHLCY